MDVSLFSIFLKMQIDIGRDHFANSFRRDHRKIVVDNGMAHFVRHYRIGYILFRYIYSLKLIDIKSLIPLITLVNTAIFRAVFFDVEYLFVFAIDLIPSLEYLYLLCRCQSLQSPRLHWRGQQGLYLLLMKLKL